MPPVVLPDLPARQASTGEVSTADVTDGRYVKPRILWPNTSDPISPATGPIAESGTTQPVKIPLTVIGSASLSLLLNKPLVRNVLHAGGRIFASDQDPNVRLIEYWIGNPSPQGQDEFSTATYAMFTPPANASYGTFSPQNAMNGACNSN